MSSLKQSAPPAKRSKKFIVIVLLLFFLGAVGAIWYGERQKQSGRDDQSTAYRSPQIADQSASKDVAQSSKPTEQALPDQHPLDEVLKLAMEIRDHLKAEVVDYTATMIKRERVKGKLGKEEHMEVKIRNPQGEGDSRVPLSAYLKFIPPSSSAGREVIWVDGRDDGQLHTYQFGLRISLDPNGTLAMMGNKYPITEIGLVRMAEKLIEKGHRDRDRELGSCQVEIFEDQLVAGRACKLIQVTHPNRHAKFDFHIAQIYIDNELQAPIRYAAYMWPESPGEQPPLEEEYTFTNLKLNVGLKEIDFDTENPEYKFP